MDELQHPKIFRIILGLCVKTSTCMLNFNSAWIKDNTPQNKIHVNNTVFSHVVHFSVLEKASQN